MKKRMGALALLFLAAGVFAEDDSVEFKFTKAPVTPVVEGLAEGMGVYGWDLQTDYTSIHSESMDADIYSIGLSPIMYFGTADSGFSYAIPWSFLSCNDEMFNTFFGLNMGIFDMEYGKVVSESSGGSMLVLFGGGKFGINLMQFETDILDFFRFSIEYGLNFGAKYQVALDKTFSLVPFYTMALSSGWSSNSMTIDYGSIHSFTSSDEMIPWAASHVIGLDILIAEYSLGAMADFGGEDTSMFSLNLTIPLSKTYSKKNEEGLYEPLAD